MSCGNEYILELKQVIRNGKTEKVEPRSWKLGESDFERFELAFEENEMVSIPWDPTGWKITVKE